MFDRFSLADLTVRVVGAPMAGGPTTPLLAAAVSNAGGLGFLAAGSMSADELAAAIVATRKLTSGPIGVNLFAPQQSTSCPENLAEFAAALSPDAEHYGVTLGEPRTHDDEWATKLEVVCDLRPEVVSFTFGLPTSELCARLTRTGIVTVATVTTVLEGVIALSRGIDALVAQGPSAGGHRATFDALATPPDDPLDDLVTALVACFDCPVIAAGGVGTPNDVRRLRDAGATAVQLGTALLLADEAGTNPVYRAALRDPCFTETVLTRAFTGRYARALRNRFIEAHEGQAVSDFPRVAMITAPLQAAAIAKGDPHGIALWAGAQFRHARTGPATDIVRELAG